MRYFEIYAWEDCPYCIKAKELLVKNDHQFVFCCIDQSDILLQYIQTKWGWTTVPMIIEKYTTTSEVKFIGGYTDLVKYLEEK